ncbi:MAG: restriction endonuclease subunit S [Bacteroidota bacterium]
MGKAMKKGWEVKTLAHIAENLDNKRVPVTKNVRNAGRYPYYGASGIVDYVSDYLFDDDLLLVSEDGANLLARTYPIAFSISGKSWVNNHAHILRFKDNVSQRFVEYYLNSIILDDYVSGMAQPKLNQKMLNLIPIPYPPLPEQHRIVAILDEAFAAIAKAKENAEKNLANAREVFESYLQSVIANRDDGWEEYTMEELCQLITCGVAATPKYVDESEGVPFLSAQNVRDGEVVLDKYRCISKQFHQELTKKNKPAKGDVLYSRVGSKFGEAGVVEHEFEFSVYVSLTLIKPKSERLNSYYLKHYLNSPAIKSLAKKSISSSGVPNLNVKDVREFPIICPSISIQHKIVRHIDILSAETKKLEAIYQQKLEDLDDLKKTILEKAFAGELNTN